LWPQTFASCFKKGVGEGLIASDNLFFSVFYMIRIKEDKQMGRSSHKTAIIQGLSKVNPKNFCGKVIFSQTIATRVT
jgi:hypothetical protein